MKEVNKFSARLNLQGDFDGAENSKRCKLKNCVTLKDGVIYKCSILPGINKFQNYFGESIVESDDGGNMMGVKYLAGLQKQINYVHIVPEIMMYNLIGHYHKKT